MYKHILIPTDGSPLSELAIRQGIKLAKSIGAKVTAVTVFPPFHAIAVEPMMIWSSGYGRTRVRQRDDEGPDPHPNTVLVCR